MVVKRLVTIEDLGNIEVLFTDKTGTLTEGRIAFQQALGRCWKRPRPTSRPALQLGCGGGRRPCSGATRWTARSGRTPGAGTPIRAAYRRLGEVPFDYDRRLMSVLVETGDDRRLITKGAPEAVLARCAGRAPESRPLPRRLFAAGSARGRRRHAGGERGRRPSAPDDEQGL